MCNIRLSISYNRKWQEVSSISIKVYNRVVVYLQVWESYVYSGLQREVWVQELCLACAWLSENVIVKSHLKACLSYRWRWNVFVSLSVVNLPLVWWAVSPWVTWPVSGSWWVFCGQQAGTVRGRPPLSVASWLQASRWNCISLFICKACLPS